MMSFQIFTNGVSDLRISLLSEAQKRVYYQDMLAILKAVDYEFVPPLSQRDPTPLPGMSQEDIECLHGSVTAYLNEMLYFEQVLGIFVDDRLVGMVSFIENEKFEILEDKDLPNIYVCTVAVSPEFRGLGITRKAYQYLFFDVYKERNIFTRTWSTNTAHSKILLSMGFREFKRIPNDRGAEIDTVYYENRRL